MNKLMYSVALATGLALSLAGSSARADAIQSLSMADMSASQFNSLFTPIDTAPVLSSPFKYADAPVSGTVNSQVFQGTGAAAGLYAYAYQYALNNVADGDNTPVDLRGTSWKFNATPVGSDFTNTGQNVYAYSIKDGAVGGLGAPVAAPGQGILSPSGLNWLPSTSTGSLLATYFDSSKDLPALKAGATSATFVVLSDQPFTQKFVGILGSNPIDPQSSLTSAYAATGGTIQPVPIPEPTTVLAWAGMASAVALVRRIRKNRTPLV
jgi:hypothetical protein